MLFLNVVYSDSVCSAGDIYHFTTHVFSYCKVIKVVKYLKAVFFSFFMALTDLIHQGKETFYDVIFKASMAFPYAGDVMRVGMIGVAPFLAGKYGAELIGRKIPFFREYSDVIGFASSALSELVWWRVIEPQSPYDHPDDTLSDYKGMAETALGAGLAFLATRLIT